MIWTDSQFYCLGEREDCCRLAAKYVSPCHEHHNNMNPLCHITNIQCLIINNEPVIFFYTTLLPPITYCLFFIYLCLLCLYILCKHALATLYCMQSWQ